MIYDMSTYEYQSNTLISRDCHRFSLSFIKFVASLFLCVTAMLQLLYLNIALFQSKLRFIIPKHVAFSIASVKSALFVGREVSPFPSRKRGKSKLDKAASTVVLYGHHMSIKIGHAARSYFTPYAHIGHCSCKCLNVCVCVCVSMMLQFSVYICELCQNN
jgi:hypothetical protein